MIDRKLERGEVFEYPNSVSDTLLFGSEGQLPQETLITDEPLLLSPEKKQKFDSLVRSLVGVIDEFKLEGSGEIVGVDYNYLNSALALDRLSRSSFQYGGVDIYWNNGNPKILEINTRPQVMGFQDSRQDYLGVSEHQPRMIDHFTKWLSDNDYSNIYILASRQNPFWRGYEWSNRNLQKAGFKSAMGDATEFTRLIESGISPELIWRLTNSHFIIYSDKSEGVRNVIASGTPVVNSLSSQFIGDRGFLIYAGSVAPELFPRQILLDQNSGEDEINLHPWIKLETGDEFAYVVNYHDLRRWGRDALTGAIKRDPNMIENSLGGKDSQDAQNIRTAAERALKVPVEQVRWVAQEEVKPEEVSLQCGGVNTELKVLHRVY